MTPIPLLALFFLSACTAATKPVNDVRYLDPGTPSLAQPIEPGEIAPDAKVKFVQVEVTEVVNPRLVPLTFEVHYDRSGEPRIHLGDFSLYPPDHPGRFIVATQGRVKPDGTLVLIMTSSDEIKRGDSIRVAVKRMRFLRQ